MVGMENNLYSETIYVLTRHGKTVRDIRWIGTEEAKFPSPYNDIRISFNIIYDNDYGRQVINHDLLVVGDDWWLERHEYDGSEWWEYKTMPKEPSVEKVPNVDNLEFS